MMHGSIFLLLVIFLLFTVGMGLIGLSFLSYLKETVERRNLIERYK